MLYEQRNSEAIAAILNTSDVKRNSDGPPAETRCPGIRVNYSPIERYGIKLQYTYNAFNGPTDDFQKTRAVYLDQVPHATVILSPRIAN